MGMAAFMGSFAAFAGYFSLALGIHGGKTALRFSSLAAALFAALVTLLTPLTPLAATLITLVALISHLIVS